MKTLFVRVNGGGSKIIYVMGHEVLENVLLTKVGLHRNQIATSSVVVNGR